MLARTGSIWSAKRTERRHGTTPRPGGSLGERPRRGGLLDGQPRWPRSRRTKLRAAATRSARRALEEHKGKQILSGSGTGKRSGQPFSFEFVRK